VERRSGRRGGTDPRLRRRVGRVAVSPT
jgi:hypothetical protein